MSVVNVRVVNGENPIIKITSTPPVVEADVLAYLQSLPTSEPSTPNMPWWNNNVLNRSAVGFTFRRPGGVGTYIRPSTGTYLRA